MMEEAKEGFTQLQVEGDDGKGPIKSIEGYIIIVTNISEEAQEEDILDIFGQFGVVRNIHVNLDRLTGFAKGYALLEFASLHEAK